MTRRRPPRSASRGAALLTALVIVTLIVTLAASMVWQQWRAVQVESAERARRQAGWILSGALDWSRLILREDARSGGADHLGEPWAVPLAEARLSTFLASDKDNTDDAPDAFLSGRIVDAQGLFNLRNLIGDKGEIVPEAVQALQRLCEFAGVSSTTAGVIAGGLQPRQGSGNETPLTPQSLSQIGWLGIAPAVMDKLRPFVVLLPRRTTLNLNTAPPEVLAASIDGLDLGSAERLVQARERTPFNVPDDAKALLPQGVVLDAKSVSTASSFFEVHGRLRLGERVLEERSLVERRGLDVVVLEREQIGQVDAGP